MNNHCPPPNRFTAAFNVKRARIAECPPFATRQRYTGRRLEGIKYERKAQIYLSQLFDDYVPGFWIHFQMGDTWKYCQPDGVHFDLARGVITLVEFKYQHTSDAWWQLKHLYLPAMRAMFPEPLWRFEFVEIVKWYDASVRFPCEVKLVANPFQPSDKFKVHIWRP